MKRYQSLYEDAKLDAIFRKQAEKVYNKIKKIHLNRDHINLMYDKDEFGSLSLNEEFNLAVLRLNDIYPKECENLYFMFAIRLPHTTERAGFTFEDKGSKRAYYIVFKCIRPEEAPWLYTNKATPMLQHYINQGREEFIHEYIHYLDQLRRKDKNISITLGLAMGEYFNEPSEFNAYYQQGASTLEDDIKKKKANIRQYMFDLRDDSPTEFVNDILHYKDYWRKDFIDNLNDEYKHKFIKRLTGLFDYLKQKYIK